MSIQYTAEIDAIVYSPVAVQFTREQWLQLAKAAIEQSGLEEHQIDRIHAQIDDAGEAVG